jgi:hypothetical protein
MQIWSLPFAWKPPLSLVDDRATLQQIEDGRDRLESDGTQWCQCRRAQPRRGRARRRAGRLVAPD